MSVTPTSLLVCVRPEATKSSQNLLSKLINAARVLGDTADSRQNDDLLSLAPFGAVFSRALTFSKFSASQ